MITIKEIDKSFKSHKRAIKQMFELFPMAQFERSCSSHNDRDLKRFRVNGVPFENFAKKAHRVFVRKDELFDFGRPKIIEKDFHIYLSDFVRISMYCDIPYQVYGDYGKGKFDLLLSLEWSGNSYGIGLKDWKKNYKSVLSYFDKNPNGALVKEYRNQITEANTEVIRWRKKIAEIKVIL